MNNYNSKSYLLQWLVIGSLIIVLASILTGVITAILVYFFHHPFVSLRHHLWILFAISCLASILYFGYETQSMRGKSNLFDKLPAREKPPLFGPINPAWTDLSQLLNSIFDQDALNGLFWLFGVIGAAIAATYHFIKIHLGF